MFHGSSFWEPLELHLPWVVISFLCRDNVSFCRHGDILWCIVGDWPGLESSIYDVRYTNMWQQFMSAYAGAVASILDCLYTSLFPQAFHVCREDGTVVVSQLRCSEPLLTSEHCSFCFYRFSLEKRPWHLMVTRILARGTWKTRGRIHCGRIHQAPETPSQH